MQGSFLLQALIYFLPQIIILAFVYKQLHLYCLLYRKKINPNYPILPRETVEYLNKGAILQIFGSPVYMIKIILKRHKDKVLNDAAKKVRLSILAYLVVMVIEFIILWVILFNFSEP